MSIPFIDLAVIVGYLVLVTGAGLLAVRRLELTGEVYFLAGRALPWGIVGAALFSSNISTIHLVGLAEAGYRHGLVIGNFEWMATFTLMLLALVFAPIFHRTRIATLPEFLERRYGPECRSIAAGMAIAAALLIHIGISLYAGAAVLGEFFGVDVAVSIVLIAVITAIYTVVGGLRAVVVTETIQTGVLLLGASIITALALAELPAHGIDSLATLRAAVKPDQLSMLHTSNDQGFAWYAILLGYPVLGVWYWCTDQTIVQRILGARTERDAQHGALFAGLLKILPVFIMVLPGVAAWVLFQSQIGDDATQTLPLLIRELVPTGLRGLIAAALLAALMSTIAAALNSCGTLVAVDIAGRLRPGLSDRQQVRIGRVSAVVVMLLAMGWSTQGHRFDTIFEAINKMPAQFLAPPIATVFLWGVFWRRGTRQAAFVTLVLGFSIGVVAFLVDLPVVGDTQLITEGWGVSFMMQAWWGFCLCSGIFVVTSLSTPAPSGEQLEGLTWESPWRVLTRGRVDGPSDPRLLAGGLLALMLGLYAIFR